MNDGAPVLFPGFIDPSRDVESPARRVREDGPSQPALFELPPAREDWEVHWWGMPRFEMGDARASYRITVNFHTYEDVREFARRLGILVTSRTDSAWFPPEASSAPSEWRYVDEP